MEGEVADPHEQIGDLARALEVITALRQQVSTLESARVDAERDAKAKADFLASMSHEIRTPMNGVLGAGQLLAATPLSTEQRDYVQTLISSGDALLGLLDGVLDLSKLEAGNIATEKVPFDVRVMVGDVAEMLAEQADGRDLSLSVVVDPAIPEQLIGDPIRVRQVLTNLVGNAIKFTPSGEVAIRADRVAGDALRIRFTVRDTGIGVAHETSHRLFQSFVQADASTTRIYGGTGLGLAISRRIVEHLGGTIGIGRQSVGSTFWFEVPFGQTSAASVLPDVTGAHVVVISDQPARAKVIEEILAQRGALVRTAIDGPTPRAIVLDVEDPAPIAKKLRASGQLLILVAPWSRRPTESAIRSMGCDAMITRPLRESALIAAIQGVPRPVAPAPSPVPTDLPHRTVLLVEDNLVNQRIGSDMLRRMGVKVVIAPNGAEALDRLAERTFDLVLMDCQMPLVDGYEATRRLRVIEGTTTRRTPVVALTAHALEGESDRCFDAGMDAWLTKPVRVKDLAATVDKYCGPL